jgi:hypothetical protein
MSQHRSIRLTKAKNEADQASEAPTGPALVKQGIFHFYGVLRTWRIVMVALLVGGEIEGARVGPDLVQKVK